jgi:hypothetical protein
MNAGVRLALQRAAGPDENERDGKRGPPIRAAYKAIGADLPVCPQCRVRCGGISRDQLKLSSPVAASPTPPASNAPMTKML